VPTYIQAALRYQKPLQWIVCYQHTLGAVAPNVSGQLLGTGASYSRRHGFNSQPGRRQTILTGIFHILQSLQANARQWRILVYESGRAEIHKSAPTIALQSYGILIVTIRFSNSTDMVLLSYRPTEENLCSSSLTGLAAHTWPDRGIHH
jgi:hypothetical protein